VVAAADATRWFQMKHHAESLSSCKSVANPCSQWRMRMNRSGIFYMGTGGSCTALFRSRNREDSGF
jgi:hypothetical protein